MPGSIDFSGNSAPDRKHLASSCRQTYAEPLADAMNSTANYLASTIDMYYTGPIAVQQFMKQSLNKDPIGMKFGETILDIFIAIDKAVHGALSWIGLSENPSETANKPGINDGNISTPTST